MGRSATAALTAAIVFGLGAVAAIAGTGDGGGAPADAAFRLEDGSAGCAYRSGEIACRSADGEAAVVLRASGDSRVDPDAEVAWDDTTPVLLASESWWNGDVSCRVSGARILCTAGGGSISASTGGDAS